MKTQVALRHTLDDLPTRRYPQAGGFIQRMPTPGPAACACGSGACQATCFEDNSSIAGAMGDHGNPDPW